VAFVGLVNANLPDGVSPQEVEQRFRHLFPHMTPVTPSYGLERIDEETKMPRMDDQAAMRPLS